MNLVRAALHEAVDASSIPEGDLRATHTAFDRICDIELAVMLETYREAYVHKLRATERLATLGELAASIGHDLRNPLAVIETSLHLLGRKVEGDARAAKHLARIQSQVTISNTIITDLLELARDRPAERAPVDVSTVLDEALASLPESDRVIVTASAEPGLPPASIDAGQVRQLLVNLIVNGAQSVTREGGSGHVWVHAAREGAGALLLRIEDDGPGVDPAVLPHIFEPLFTTRATGIGLGLSICRRIAEKHGGNITAEARPEGGARFTTVLPLAFGGEP
jgi:signal transduction histidine kinase